MHEDFRRPHTGGGAANKTAEGYGAARGSRGRGGGRGRGRGRGFGRGRGRGDYNKGHGSSGGKGSTRMEGACWYCKKAGHPWFRCFSRPEGWAPPGMKPPSGERARGGAVQGSGAQGDGAHGKADPGMFLMDLWQLPIIPWNGKLPATAAAAATAKATAGGEETAPSDGALDSVKKVQQPQQPHGEVLAGVDATAAWAKASSGSGETDWEMWHERLCHVNFPMLQKLVKDGSLKGLEVKGAVKEIGSCPTCLETKFTKFPFNSGTRPAKAPLALVHMDVVGPTRAPSLSGSRYFLTIVDDNTRAVWVYPLKTKREVAAAALKEWMPRAQRERGHKVMVIRTDNRGEFIGADFEAVLKKKGIQHQLTVPYNPQQNDVAERFKRTLQEGARTLLGRAGLPDPFWVTALRQDALVKNRVLATVGDKQWAPYTKWYGSAPAVNMLRAYGCMVVFHVPKEKRGKLEASGRWGVHLGLAKDHKGWLIWDLTSQQLTVSRDVKFLESLYYKEWKQQQEELPTTPLIIEADEVQRPSRQVQVTVSDEEISGVTEDGGEPEVEEQQQQQQDAPPSEALSGPDAEKWKQSVKEEYDSLLENETWELCELPPGKKTISSKLIFRHKYGPDGELARYKSRLVAKGFQQTKGKDFDEIFAPVGKGTTLRVMLGMAANHGWRIKQMDITIAFLNGIILEELYMLQPEGLDDGSGRVCRLKKAIYGLKQAPRAWYHKLEETLLAGGFKKNECDHRSFLLQEKEQFLMLLVYVDDILLFSESSAMIERVEEMLEMQFKCSKMGDVKYYLGMHVERDLDKRVLRLHQRKYCEGLAEKYGLQDGGKPATPLPSGFTVEPCADEEVVGESDRKLFHSMVGALNYAANHTRPDITFATPRLASVVSRPSHEQLEVAKRLVRYMSATLSVGLEYSAVRQRQQWGAANLGKGEMLLTCYTDASFNSVKADGTSIGGYVCLFGGGAVSWRSKKQNEVGLSSCETEYMALHHGVKEVVWLRRLLEEIGVCQREPTIMFSDNESAVKLAKNACLHGLTKHIRPKWHWVRRLLDKCAEKRNEPPPSKIEALDGSKYEEWSGRMRSAFKRYKLLKLAMGEEKMQEEGDARTRWIEKSAVLYDLIFQSVNNDMFQHIKDLVELDDSRPKAWKLLHDVIQPNSFPMEIVLEKELTALSMRPGNDVKPILDKIKDTYARMAAAGINVSQMQQCTKIISVLDNSWDNLIPTLNTQQDQWTPEWLRQQILQEDFRRHHTGGAAANKTAEGYGAAGGSRGRGGGRGRGRGRGFGRGRGRGDYNEGHGSSGGRGSTRMEGACWYCKKAGHPWFNCFSRPEGWAPPGMKPPSGERARGGAVHGSGAQGDGAHGKADPGMFLMVEDVKGSEGDVGSVGKVVMHPLTHWVIDSGCTSHMTPRADLLDEVKPPGKIKFVAAASGALLPVIGVGNAKNSKAKVTFRPTSCRAKLGKLLVWDLEEKSSCIKDLWQLPIIPWNGKLPATAAAAATGKATAGGEEIAPPDGALDAVKKVQKATATTWSGEADWETWHERLCHVNFPMLQKLVKDGSLKGLEVKGALKEIGSCPTCLETKFTKFPFSSGTGPAKAPLTLVHMDVVGPTRAPSLSGSRYFLTIVDDHARAVWVYPLPIKGEVAAAVLKEWMPRAQRESEHKVFILVPNSFASSFIPVSSHVAHLSLPLAAPYSSPTTAALSRLFLPYLFPDLAAFPTVADLITHLRTSDTRYRAALPAEFCAKNPPPLYLTLYYVVTRLPDSLRVVRDYFLSVCPTTLTVDLLEERLLAAEQSIVAVGASRGDPRTPIFEGCSPSPLLPSVASAAAADLGGFESGHQGYAFLSVHHRS
ncbi:unnamed protein product [Closterium sp. NIES-53]